MSKKDIKLENAHILFGDALARLKELPDNSVDSIVTDPPYGLSDNKHVATTIEKWITNDRSFIPDGKGFMGKAWDSFVPPPAIWDECLRVLKPGGHLLAFFGSRTQDIGALSIRLAGFEIRDSIAWVYGSGFPKSMDISKAIDKQGGSSVELKPFQDMLLEAKNKTKLKATYLNELLTGKKTTNIWSHYVGNIQPMLPTYENYIKLKSVLKISDKWDAWFNRAAEREVIGKTTKGNFKSDMFFGGNEDSTSAIGYGEWDITAPATPQAKQYAGWGTALKPAVEPIVVARKPLSESTVANNVLKWGTGGLNIDASRITIAEGDTPSAGNRTATFGTQETISGGDGSGGYTPNTAGRFPANIILDESAAEMLDEQSGVSKSVSAKMGQGIVEAVGLYRVKNKDENFESVRGHNDTGGASRFFYVAKASKKDRNEGLDGLPEKHKQERKNKVGRRGYCIEDKRWQEAREGKLCSKCNNEFTREQNDHIAMTNFHPTVKPTSLMEYLIKLVTPVGGTVLDPFTGSGSTGKAALLNGFKFIGCELTEEYLPIIEGRLKFAADKYAKQQAEKAQEAAETLFPDEEN